MAEGITFDQVLAQVGQGGANVEELQARRERLRRKAADLQAKLADVNRELRGVEAGLNAPLREALKAAKILGVEVPEPYRQQAVGGNGGRSSGRFWWEAPGHVPFQAEVSRAMWRLSQGSGGSAGKNGEGVLTAEEFWGMAGMSAEQAELGRKYEVDLPNGRHVVFQRMQD